MTDADLPARLHELHVELLRELLARGADRAWLAERVQASVDLVHAVAEQRPPDPRHAAQLKRAQWLLAMLEAAARAGSSPEDAQAAARERLGMRDRAWFRLLRDCRDLEARPRLTLGTLEGRK